jgi:hypothetical protein
MRTASDPLRASRKRIAELWKLGNVDLDLWAVWLIQSSTAFFTRETLTRLSHLIRVNERSLHKRSGEPRSVREEMSRRPAPRSKPPDVPSGANGCSAAITASPTSRPRASLASIARALPVPALVRLARWTKSDSGQRPIPRALAESGSCLFECLFFSGRPPGGFAGSGGTVATLPRVRGILGGRCRRRTWSSLIKPMTLSTDAISVPS